MFAVVNDKIMAHALKYIPGDMKMRKWLKVVLFGTVFITVIAYFALFIMCGMIAFVTLDAAIFGEVLHRLTWHGFRLTVVVSFFISFIVFSFDN